MRSVEHDTDTAVPVLADTTSENGGAVVRKAATMTRPSSAECPMRTTLSNTEKSTQETLFYSVEVCIVCASLPKRNIYFWTPSKGR